MRATARGVLCTSPLRCSGSNFVHRDRRFRARLSGKSSSVVHRTCCRIAVNSANTGGVPFTHTCTCAIEGAVRFDPETQASFRRHCTGANKRNTGISVNKLSRIGPIVGALQLLGVSLDTIAGLRIPCIYLVGRVGCSERALLIAQCHAASGYRS